MAWLMFEYCACVQRVIAAAKVLYSSHKRILHSLRHTRAVTFMCVCAR